MVFEGMDDVQAHLHSIWLCNMGDYDRHMCNLTTMFQLYTKQIWKAAAAAAPAWQSRQGTWQPRKILPMQRAAIRPEGAEPGTQEPTVLEPSVEATCPSGDGAGAGAAGAGGPAGVGEGVEMADGEDGSSNPVATFIQPTNWEEYSETSTDAGSIYSPSDER